MKALKSRQKIQREINNGKNKSDGKKNTLLKEESGSEIITRKEKQSGESWTIQFNHPRQWRGDLTSFYSGPLPPRDW
jgi:hypothetical protein